MQRDQQESSLKSRGQSRKEWGYGSTDNERQMEAREQGRQTGRLHKTYGVRSQEAERQIRELRARY